MASNPHPWQDLTKINQKPVKLSMNDSRNPNQSTATSPPRANRLSINHAMALAGCKTKRQVRTASLTQVRQPIYKTSVERWRK
jgi:hypothetical protein